jgi:hypothetical protein
MVSTQGSLWIYGGTRRFLPGSCASIDSDVYTLTLSSDGLSGNWSQTPVASTGPEPRFFHSAVIIPGTPQMLIFGGVNSLCNILSDIWVFDTTTFIWRQFFTSTNIKSHSHVAVFHTQSSSMFVFGIQNGLSGYLPFNGNPLTQVPSVQKFQFGQSPTTTGPPVNFFVNFSQNFNENCRLNMKLRF